VVLLLGVILVGGSAQPAASHERHTEDLSQMSLEQLMGLEVETVSGASRFEQKVTEAPSAITVVTGDDIRAHGYRTLAEVLRDVRGLFTTADRNYEYLGVRGFGRTDDYNARFLLLVDGHRENDNLYEGAALGPEFPLDLDLVERVEVIRGPGSSVYGTNALLGVINVVTRAATSLAGVRATGEVGSLGERRGMLAWGGQVPGGPSIVLSGTLFASDGHETLYYPEYDDPGTNDGRAERVDGDRGERGFATASWGDFRLQALYGSRRKVVPTGSWGALFNDGRNWSLDQRGWVELSWQRQMADRTDVTARAAWDSYNYIASYVYDYSEDPAEPFYVVNRDENHGRWWNAELALRRPVGSRNTVAAGVEYRDNYMQNQRNYDEDPYATYTDDRRGMATWALYAEDAILLHPRVRLDVGVRHDHYPVFGSSTSPRAGLIFSPADRTSVKLLFGSAFRIPTSYELYYSDAGYSANQDLEPETIRTGELVVESWFGRHYRAAASVFEYRMRHLITEMEAEDGTLQFGNRQTVASRGFEAEVAGTWWNGFGGRLSYTHQEIEDRSTGEWFANSPRDVAQAGAHAPLVPDLLSLSASLQYLGKRRTLTGAEATAHALTNVTLEAGRRGGRWSMTAAAYNVFDARYADPGAREHLQDQIAQDGRTLRLILRARY
jgi:iron complex outermembrane receptor protein